MAGSGIDILSLSNLLQETHTQEDKPSTDNSANFSVVPKKNTGPILPPNSKPSTSASKPSPSSNDIWDIETIPSSEVIKTDPNDKRPVPHHEILFKQSVGSGEVFLGLSEKSPSSSDCTHIVVKIYFPRHQMKDIELDVTKNMLSAESDKFRLKVYLPREVDFDNGNAKFEKDGFILTVTLPIAEQQW